VRFGVFAAVLFAPVFAAEVRSDETPPAPLGLGREFAPGRILSGETTRRVLHFTFDDGPDPRTTPSLLAALDNAGIKATFFFSACKFRGLGAAAQRARELAVEVRRRGHGIGSHSVDHVRMRTMRPDQLDAQLAESDRLFREIFGDKTFLFRPPWGSHSPALDARMAARADTLVMWNLGMADWVERPPQELADSFLRRLDRAEREHGQRGGIVLMHDTHAWSIAALPLIVRALRERNCELGARGEELYEFADDLSPWGAGDSGACSPQRQCRTSTAQPMLVRPNIDCSGARPQ
jgi:peptidoglycan/xylan/chitin deacetylase (PgdA/CDA1 family)